MGEALEGFRAVKLPKFTKQLERWLLNEKEASTSGEVFFAGDQPTYADVLALELFEYVSHELPAAVAGDTPLALECPNLWKHWDRMRSFEHIAQYLKSQNRVPGPDDTFVRRTCDILGMKLPDYLGKVEKDAY